MLDLELRGVTKTFDSFTAVRDFEIQVDKGEFISFLGPSGCGKTTTLRMIAGFIEPTKGDIYIQGRRVNDVPPYRRDTGMVFQNYALFPHMTVFDNIAFGLRYRKVPKREIRSRVEEMLRLVQLPGVEGRKPAQLSGGQQQRIALARALVIRPKVLLFDEPLSNLDAKLREELRVELRQIQRNVGITSIFVTHDQEEALALSDRIVVMDRGQITQVGTPAEIYEDPASPFVGEFIGQSNFLDGTVRTPDGEVTAVDLGGGLTVRTAPGEPVQAGDPVRVLVRAERVNVSREPPGAEGAKGLNVWEGTVETVTYLGSKVHYYVRIGSGHRILAIEQTEERRPLQEGETAYLEVGFKSCRYFRAGPGGERG